MSDPFQIIAEQSRRRILDALRTKEMSVGELVRRLPLSQPAISKHLRLLRDAGLVEVRVDAQRRFYRLRAASLAGVLKWIEPYRVLLKK